MKFVNRSEELDSLEKRYSSDNFEFVVLYGRRRVGKTELIKKFSKDRPHIYFLSPQDTELMQINKFLKKISDHFDEVKPDINSWDACVDYLKSKLEEEKIIFSIDEFPYLVQNNRAILSYLQGMIDDIKSESMLIICGSSISVMESDVMGHKSPLFGRRTGQIDLQPFDFSTSLKSIRYPFEEAVRSYSVTGGTPMYLLNFDYSRPLKDNIKDKILDKTSFMYEEPSFLLRTELRNPNRYLSILEALANGHTKPNSISNATGIDPGPLSKYLKTLRKLRLIEREIPVTAEQKRSKRSIYKIKDNFFRFWFQFIEPKKSWIEEAPKKVLTDDILPTLDIYTSKIFEDICMEYIWKNYDYHKVGRWWFKEDEIDIVALNERENKILLGECRWSKNKVGFGLLKDLKEKAKEVRWKNGERDEDFFLFSRSGFTKNLKEEVSDSKDIHLVTLQDMENKI
ncbi:MAG: ATP-binding protein [Candidatus Saliniplasma sp.]